MKQQENSQNSNWYNNRFVMMLVFIAVYIIVPVLITVWGTVIVTDNTFTFTRISPDEISRIGIVYLLIAIAFPFLYRWYYQWITQIPFNKIKKEIVKDLSNDSGVIWKNLVSDAILGSLRHNETINSYTAFNVEKFKDEIIEELEKLNWSDIILKSSNKDDTSTQGNDNSIIEKQVTKYLEDQKVKDAISNALKTDPLKVDGIKLALKAAMKENDVKNIVEKEVNDAISSALDSVKNQTASDIAIALKKNYNAKTALKETLDSDNVKNAVTAALNDKNTQECSPCDPKRTQAVIDVTATEIVPSDDLEKAVKALFDDESIKAALGFIGGKIAMREALSDNLGFDKVKTGITDALRNGMHEAISNKICDCVQEAVNNEKDAQKYRFAERMVGEICKNNSKPSATEITEIRKLIGGIIGSISEKYCLGALEDGNVTIIRFNDDGQKTLLLRFNNDDQSLTAINSNGCFIFGNMLQVTINDNSILEIKKLPIPDSKEE